MQSRATDEITFKNTCRCEFYKKWKTAGKGLVANSGPKSEIWVLMVGLSYSSLLLMQYSIMRWIYLEELFSLFLWKVQWALQLRHSWVLLDKVSCFFHSLILCCQCVVNSLIHYANQLDASFPLRFNSDLITKIQVHDWCIPHLPLHISFSLLPIKVTSPQLQHCWLVCIYFTYSSIRMPC